MYNRGLLISGILVMLTACVSLGASVDFQEYLIDGTNSAGVAGGPGAATDGSVTIVGQLQQGSYNWGLVRTVQGQVGALGQVAGAGGMGGLFVVEQEGQAFGAQLQSHLGGPASLGLQNQLANVALAQEVTKLGGLGAAFGLQSFVGAQVQIVATPYGINVNVQPVSVAVFQTAGQ